MKETFYKIRPSGDKAYCVVRASEFAEALRDWLYCINPGEELVVSTVQMTEKQFEKMPEYEG